MTYWHVNIEIWHIFKFFPGNDIFWLFWGKWHNILTYFRHFPIFLPNKAISKVVYWKLWAPNRLSREYKGIERKVTRFLQVMPKSIITRYLPDTVQPRCDCLSTTALMKWSLRALARNVCVKPALVSSGSGTVIVRSYFTSWWGWRSVESEMNALMVIHLCVPNFSGISDPHPALLSPGWIQVQFSILKQVNYMASTALMAKWIVAEPDFMMEGWYISEMIYFFQKNDIFWRILWKCWHIFGIKLT